MMTVTLRQDTVTARDGELPTSVTAKLPIIMEYLAEFTFSTHTEFFVKLMNQFYSNTYKHKHF